MFHARDPNRAIILEFEKFLYLLKKIPLTVTWKGVRLIHELSNIIFHSVHKY